MKRNHTTQRLAKSGIPPYTRYKKRPYRYSERLRQWEREMGARASQAPMEDKNELR